MFIREFGFPPIPCNPETFPSPANVHSWQMSPALIDPLTTSMKSGIYAASDDDSSMEEAVRDAVKAINQCSRLPKGRSRRRLLNDARTELCSALESSIISARENARDSARKARKTSSRKRERRRVVVSSSDDSGSSDDEDYDAGEAVERTSRYPRRNKRASTPLSLYSSSGDESDESDVRRRPRRKRRRQSSGSNSPSPRPERRSIPSIHISSDEPGARRSSRLASAVAAALEPEEEILPDGYYESEIHVDHGEPHVESDEESELSTTEELVLPVVRPRPLVMREPLAADRYSKTPVYSSDDEHTDKEETEYRRAARHLKLMQDGQEERITELYKTMPMHQIMDEPPPQAVSPTPVHGMYASAHGTNLTSPSRKVNKKVASSSVPQAQDAEEKRMLLSYEIAQRGIKRRSPPTPRVQPVYPPYSPNRAPASFNTNQYRSAAQSYAMPARNQVQVSQSYSAPVSHTPVTSNPAYYITPTAPRVPSQLRRSSTGTPAVSQPVRMASTQVRVGSIPTHTLQASLPSGSPDSMQQESLRRRLLQRTRVTRPENQLPGPLHPHLPFETSQAQQVQRVLQTSQAQQVQHVLHTSQAQQVQHVLQTTQAPGPTYHGQAAQSQQDRVPNVAQPLNLQQQLANQQLLHQARANVIVQRAKQVKDAQKQAHLRAMAHAQANFTANAAREKEAKELMELQAALNRKQEAHRKREAALRAEAAAHALQSQNALKEANEYAEAHKNIVQMYNFQENQHKQANYEIQKKLAESESRVQKENTLAQIEQQFQIAVQPVPDADAAKNAAMDAAKDAAKSASKEKKKTGKMLDKAIQSPARETVDIVDEIEAATAKSRVESLETPASNVDRVEFAGPSRN